MKRIAAWLLSSFLVLGLAAPSFARAKSHSRKINQTKSQKQANKAARKYNKKAAKQQKKQLKAANKQMKKWNKEHRITRTVT